MSRKTQLEQSRKSLAIKLEEMRKLNKVHGVGRTPQVVIALLQALDKAGIAEQFLTMGTHALYAYEAACESVPKRWPLGMSIFFTTHASMSLLSPP